LDHSAQNLVTTSSGECIMLLRNAPARLVNPHPDHEHNNLVAYRLYRGMNGP
jgi:hypothetical protein